MGLPTGVTESMYKVLACLRDQHDYRLVLLAVLICGLASLSYLLKREAEPRVEATRMDFFDWRGHRSGDLGDPFRGHAHVQDRPPNGL